MLDTRKENKKKKKIVVPTMVQLVIRVRFNDARGPCTGAGARRENVRRFPGLPGTKRIVIIIGNRETDNNDNLTTLRINGGPV